MLKQRCHERREGGEESDSRRKAIDTIDEIERVRATNEPQDGSGKSPPNGKTVAPNAGEMDASKKGHGGSGRLAKKFLPRLEADEVVEQAGCEDQGGGG